MMILKMKMMTSMISIYAIVITMITMTRTDGGSREKGDVADIMMLMTGQQISSMNVEMVVMAFLKVIKLMAMMNDDEHHHQDDGSDDEHHDEGDDETVCEALLKG